MAMSLEQMAEENAKRFLEARLAALIIVGSALGGSKIAPNDPKVELSLKFLSAINGVPIPAQPDAPKLPRAVQRVNTILGS
jgi:hypothetical protein